MGTSKRKLGQTNAKTKNSYRGWGLGCIVACGLLAGCQSFKEATYSSTGAAIGAGIGTVVTSGAIAPILGAAVGASTGSVIANVNSPEEALQEIKPSFGEIIDKLILIGGWWLILFVVGPLILGWLVPGPFQVKHKDK